MSIFPPFFLTSRPGSSAIQIILLLLEEKRIAPEDLDILQVMDEPKEIVKAIKKVIIV